MDTNYDVAGSIIAGLGVLAILIVIILVPIVIVYLVAKCKMYKKAGKNGWEAIVPFYSDWVYSEIAGVEWWWFVALIASNIIKDDNLSKMFYSAKGEFSEIPHTEVYVLDSQNITQFLEKSIS